MAASTLLASNTHPTDADIDAAMAGNICRGGTYQRIRAAIKRAAQGSTTMTTVSRREFVMVLTAAGG